MVVIDHFNGGKVALMLPPPMPTGSPGDFAGRPNILVVNVSNVTLQEGLPTGPNPHRIIDFSLWFPVANMFLTMGMFTDDVAAQAYGKSLVDKTYIWWEECGFTNFKVYPYVPMSLTNRIEVSMTGSQSCPVLRATLNPDPNDILTFPFSRIPPEDPLYAPITTPMTLTIPRLTLEFRGFGEPFQEIQEYTMPRVRDYIVPRPTEYTMTQVTQSRPAWVSLETDWIKSGANKFYNPIKFVGTLYQSGTRTFNCPPPVPVSGWTRTPRSRKRAKKA